MTDSEQDRHLVNNFDTRKCDTLQPRAAAVIEFTQRAASSYCRVAEMKSMQGAAFPQYGDVNQPRAEAESNV